MTRVMAPHTKQMMFDCSVYTKWDLRRGPTPRRFSLDFIIPRHQLLSARGTVVIYSTDFRGTELNECISIK